MEIHPAVLEVLAVTVAAEAAVVSRAHKKELQAAFTEMAELAVIIRLATATAPQAEGVVLLLFFQAQVTLRLVILCLLPEAEAAAFGLGS